MTGSPPVSSLREIESHVNLMLFGVISALGTKFGGFIKVGTESATTTVSEE